jgi:hypothetical protein
MRVGPARRPSGVRAPASATDRTGLSMLAHATPKAGDIVVREETREGRVVYVLHTAPGADQYLLRTREEAVAQAVTFAKRQGVRAWLSGETYDGVLLHDLRVVESVCDVGVVMATSAPRTTDPVAAAADTSDRAPVQQSAIVAGSDIVGRAGTARARRRAVRPRAPDHR